MKVGSDADFLYYNVELHTVTGSVRVCVCLARTLLNVKRLRKWSVGELALLQFLQMGVPPQFGLPRTVLWRECVHLIGADATVAKLHELTGYMYDARDVARGMQELGEQEQAMQGGSARSGCMKRSCLLSGSIVRVLPGEVSALEYQTSREGGAVADDMETGSSSAAADFNDRLISTSVKRAAIAKSDSACRRGETEITSNIGADGKRTKARVGGHVLYVLYMYLKYAFQMHVHVHVFVFVFVFVFAAPRHPLPRCQGTKCRPGTPGILKYVIRSGSFLRKGIERILNTCKVHASWWACRDRPAPARALST